jgi:erythromycin esterase-like protein
MMASGALQEVSPMLLTHLGHVVVPLRSPDPDMDDADLRPLIPLLQGRRIVAMGEATHGTREFFQLKHRFFAFMVQRVGFRTFALEARAQDVEPANAYAQRGAGSAEAAIRALAEWPWETQEVVALLEWARRYNASVPERGRVQFRGIDFQGHNRDAHMAENLQMLAERGTQDGIFLWAHNAHVATSPGAMGAYLRRAYGQAYYVIGFEFDQGSFLSKSLAGAITGTLRNYDVTPASPRYYAYALARLPQPVAFLDFATAQHDPMVAAWLRAPHLSHQMDELYNVRRLREAWITRDEAWPSLYDAIVFVRHTTATRPLM